MKTILSLLKNRTRLERPKPAISVPAEIAKRDRAHGRRGFLFGLAGLGYGLYERSNHVAALSRPPQTFGAILGYEGNIVKTVSATDLTESEFELIARATAKAFVKRMRSVTNPIDFTLADIDEGNYFIKDMAVMKVRDWLASRPFDAMVQRRQKRVVLIEQIIASIRPGRGKGGDQVLVAVQWTEKIEAPGSTPAVEMHGGEIMVERVRNVSEEIAMHNPIGMFVSDFSFDVTS